MYRYNQTIKENVHSMLIRKYFWYISTTRTFRKLPFLLNPQVIYYNTQKTRTPSIKHYINIQVFAVIVVYTPYVFCVRAGRSCLRFLLFNRD